MAEVKKLNSIKKEKDKNVFKNFSVGKTLYIVISLLLTIGLFFGLLVVRNYFSEDIIYNERAVAISDVPKGELITEKNIDKYFAISKIPVDQDIAGSFDDLDDLLDKKLLVEIEKNEIVGKKDLSKSNKYLDNIKKPIATSIEASSISNAVGGTLRAGDVINITIVLNNVSIDADGTATNTYQMENVYVSDAKDSSGATIENTNTTTSATVLLLTIEKEDSEKLTDALNKGALIRVEKVLYE